MMSGPINFRAAKVLSVFSVFNSHLFPSSSSMPRPLAYRQLYILSNRYYTVVLKTCNEVMFFISVIPSEIIRFKFTLSLLCDDHTAAENLRRESFSTTRFDSPLSALSKDYSLFGLTYDVTLIASCELIGDLRMGTAIGPRSR
jgi:hypothetical protein